MITPDVLDRIEALKNEKQYDEAIRLVNTILSRDPHDHEALLQIADIQYRKGDMEKAGKAVDFYNHDNGQKDAMGQYLKGVIEMEKNNWHDARKFFWSSLELTDHQNHEIMRCYGLCEYWYGNRSKGLQYLEKALKINAFDAEVVYNLIEVYLLEHKYQKAAKLILFYQKNRANMHIVDKTLQFYDEKITLFEQFIKTHKELLLKA